jgi:hypothetical protein
LDRECARHLGVKHRITGDLNQCHESSGRNTALIYKDCRCWEAESTFFSMRIHT